MDKSLKRGRRSGKIIAVIVIALAIIAILSACVDGTSKDPDAANPDTVKLQSFNIIPNGNEAAAEYDVVCLDRSISGTLELFTVELVLSNIAGNPVQSFTMSGRTYTAKDFSNDSTASRVMVRNQSLDDIDGDSVTLEIQEIVYTNSKGTVRIRDPENNTKTVLLDPDFTLTADFSESSNPTAITETTVNYGDRMGLPSDNDMNSALKYRVPGLTFAGWFTEPNGEGSKVEYNDEYLYPYDITLYAHYTAAYEYRINENTQSVSITGLKDEFRTTTLLIEIPEKIEGLPVTEIADRAFASVGTDKKIMLPYSVKRIGDYAFYNCDRLSVYMPGVTSIGKSAFQNVSGGASVNFSVVNPATGTATDSVLPSTLLSIGDYAFNGTSIDTVWTVVTSSGGGSVKRLYDTLVIPQSVEYIGKEAFSASDLVAVYFPEGSALVPQNDALPEESDPDSDDVGYDFTNYFIGEKVFGGCVKLTTVYTSFTLDNGNIVPSDNPGLGIISDYMFYNCKALETVQIAEGLRLIGALAFASDSANAMKDLTTVSFPAALEVLGQQAFANTNLSSVSFSPQSEFRILGDWAFQGTEIASATFYSLTEYGKAPFWGNLAINSVYIYSDRVPDISVPSLTDMGDTSVTQTRFYVPIAQLSEYRTKWGRQYSSGGLFQDYSLQIADLILAAEYENRNAGYALEPVDEDGNLQADGITDYAKVVYLYYNGKTSLSVPETADVTINGITKYFTVTDIGGYVTVDSAATSPILTDRVTEIYLPDTVKRISDYAFYNMGKLSKLIWTYIGEGGFTMNYGQGVVDNLSLRSIGDYAFYATALETFYSSPQLTYIGAEAFADSKLHSVDLTKCDGLTIAASAFSGNKIVNLTIGSGVAELQRYCFANQDTGTAPMRIEFKGAPPTVETNLDPFGGNIVGTVVVPEAFYYKFVEDDISSALRDKYVKG